MYLFKHLKCNNNLFQFVKEGKAEKKEIRQVDIARVAQLTERSVISSVAELVDRQLIEQPVKLRGNRHPYTYSLLIDAK